MVEQGTENPCVDGSIPPLAKKNMLNKIIGLILLVSGTSIGAGMLALPIKLIGINIKISIIIFFITWLIMLISSLSMIEISLWFKKETNIITISKNIFGKNLSLILSLIYILFFYTLITAYISGIESMTKNEIIKNKIIHQIILILPFCIANYYGIKIIDQISKIFFIILIISYILITKQIIKNIDIEINLDFLHISMIIFSLPIIATSFGYSLLIPSIKHYIYNNKKYLIISILIGSIIPLMIYTIWEYSLNNFIVNIENKIIIQTFFNSYNNPTEKIIIIISNKNKFIAQLFFIFSFTAIITSLIGVSLNLYDVIFDITKKKKTSQNKIKIIIIIFVIPLIINMLLPYIFMIAISYAALIGSILLIIFPTFTLWYVRYIKKIKYKYLITKNQIILFLILFFGILIILIEILEKYYI